MSRVLYGENDMRQSNAPETEAFTWEAIARLAAKAKPGSYLRGAADWAYPKKSNKPKTMYKDTWSIPA